MHRYVQKFWHTFDISRPGLAFSAQAGLQQISEPAICSAQKNAWFKYNLTLTHTERRTENPQLRFSSCHPAEQTAWRVISSIRSTLNNFKKCHHRSKITGLQKHLVSFTNKTVQGTLKAPYLRLYKFPSNTAAEWRQQINNHYPKKNHFSLLIPKWACWHFHVVD